MSPLLKDYLNKRIVIVTTEGQCIVATLEGFDKNTNLVLIDVHERYQETPVIKIQLLRGSEVVACGLLDDTYEEKADLTVEAGHLKDTRNRIKDEYLVWEKVWIQQKANETK